jgi:hypothetical protein
MLQLIHAYHIIKEDEMRVLRLHVSILVRGMLGHGAVLWMTLSVKNLTLRRDSVLSVYSVLYTKLLCRVRNGVSG